MCEIRRGGVQAVKDNRRTQWVFQGFGVQGQEADSCGCFLAVSLSSLEQFARLSKLTDTTTKPCRCHYTSDFCVLNNVKTMHRMVASLVRLYCTCKFSRSAESSSGHSSKATAKNNQHGRHAKHHPPTVYVVPPRLKGQT
eukprot:3540075-Amphidinium_carterae.3